MDAAAAVRSQLGPTGTSATFLQRVNNVISVMCPDPIFKGWYARSGYYGSDDVMIAYKRDTPSVPFNMDSEAAWATLSVIQVYRDFLPGPCFINSSQHMVAMPIITVGYDNQGNLRAEFNATLHQVFNEGLLPGYPNGVLSHSFGHYNNKFLFIPATHTAPGYWCLEEFNANTDFAPYHIPGSYVLGKQMANTEYLSADVHPA